MKNKVYFFNKINNFIISCLPYALPLVIGFFALLKFNFLKKKATEILNYNFTDLELGIILIIIELAITTSLTLIAKSSKKYIKSSTFIKHKLYSRLRPIFFKPKYKIFRIIRNKNFNSFYYTNYKPTQKQKIISKRVSTILCDNDSSNSNTDNKVLWIQGETFSGKTMIISHILIDIISNKKYFNVFKEFDNRIIYIDLINDDFKMFIDKYKKLKFEKSILIIDNTYVLSEHNLLTLINVISNSMEAKFIIVCMREFHEVSNDPYLIKKIYDKINLSGEYYHITKIENDFSAFFNELIKTNYKLDSFFEMDTSTQFHYINMCERELNNHIEIFFDVVDFLNGRIIQNNLNHQIIFMISCICIFTGSFKKEQLIIQLSSIKNKVLLDVVLSELHSCGFINRSPYGFGEIYILNVQVARHYFKLGYTSKQFKNIVFNIIKQQYKYNLNKNYKLAFLYGCFCDDNKPSQSKLFDTIAINTNFKVFLNEMNYIESVEIKIASLYRREIGILCDRTGDFLKSRKVFKLLITDAKKQNNTNLALDSFYRLVQIDHTEYSKCVEFKKYKTNSPYLKLQKNYWKLHIDTHKGKFNFANFLDLLKETRSICRNVNYDNLHLARRIYFDVYRLYYLEGSNDPEKILKIKNDGFIIQKYLCEHLEEFNLYYKKFAILFLLSKEILFNLAVYDTVVEYDVFKYFIKDLGVTYEDMSNKNLLLEISIKLCKELEEGFEKIGDKTFNFIRYYRIELLIIINDFTIKSLIKQYRDFGTYEIEYQLYAEFIELKYKIGQLVNWEHILKDNQEDYENLKINVYQQLEIVKKYFSKSYTNEYAIMRYKIYELFLNILDKKSVSLELYNNAFNLAKKNNYNRELNLLNKIKELKFHISFGWCKNVLLYYPIVPQ